MMKAATYIKERQIFVAQSRGISLQGSQGDKGERCYTLTVDDNLFQPLSPPEREELKRGDGCELGHDHKPGKIQAVHSSSALTCSIFSHWRLNGDVAAIARACRIPAPKAKSIEYEKKLPIMANVDPKKFPKNPNIDVLISYESGSLKAVGIECKFSEAYSGRRHSGLKPAYLNTVDLWGGIPAVLKLAEEICPDDNRFCHLHAAQLIKHILGLKHAYGKKGFRLLYLWYDVPFDEGQRHRQEIEEFASIVKADGITFQHITYQEVILKLIKDHWPEHSEYLKYIADRYL